MKHIGIRAFHHLSVDWVLEAGHFYIPSNKVWGAGVYWNHHVHLSVHVSGFVQKISKPQYWIAVFSVKVTANIQNFDYCLLGWYLQNFFKPNLVYLSYTGMLCREKENDKIVIFKVKVTGLTWSIIIWLLLCILNFWIFCYQTLMIHHHKPKFLVKKQKLLCCVQVHSKGSKLYWMLVWTISSETFNFLQRYCQFW